MSSSLPVAASSESRDPGLADAGRRRIDSAFPLMPVLQAVRKHFIKTQPLSGLRVICGLAITAESANLMITLRDGGARVIGCYRAGQTTAPEDVSAALGRDYGIEVLEAMHVPREQATVVVDSGARLLRDWAENGSILAATEESANGTPRVRALERKGKLTFPVLALNESWTRRVFDRRNGVGQGTIDAIVSNAGTLFAGLTVVVAGYGRCGRGIASRFRGLGSSVIVTEVNPMSAAEALLDGFRVMTMSEAAGQAHIICTVSGNRNVVTRDHFEKMRTGVLLVNAGHSEVEIDLDTLGRMALSRRAAGDTLEEFSTRDGRRIRVLGGGRPLGLVPSPPVADTRFGLQALALEYIIKNQGSLGPHVHGVPEIIDRGVAKYKLEVMGIQIDRLTIEQEQYLANWSEGLL